MQSRECKPDKLLKFTWRVEEIGDDGECYVSLFTGPQAGERAQEYFEFLRAVEWRGAHRADSPKPTSAANCPTCNHSYAEYHDETGCHWRQQGAVRGCTCRQPRLEHILPTSAASPAGARELIAGWIQANPWAEIKVGAYDDLIQRLEAYTRERVSAADGATLKSAAKIIVDARKNDNSEADQALRWAAVRVLTLIGDSGALNRAEDAARREEAQWWYDYFLGKPQSGKLGIERLQEPRERLAKLAASKSTEGQ